MKLKASVMGMLLFLGGCAASGNQESTAIQPPKPPPEMKKFEAWTGTWSYEGPAGIRRRDQGIRGKATGRPILNGFFFEWRLEDRLQIVEIVWYDGAAKTYRWQSLNGGGGVLSGTATLNENTWTLMATEYRAREQMIVSPDGKNIAESAEISPDGKTWNPASDCRFTKISDQPDASTDFQAPKPQPQMKVMEALMGTWRHEGVAQATPFGPAGKQSWRVTGRWILNGFFGEIRTETEKNEHWLEIDWYDPIAKCFQFREFDDDGATASGTYVPEGNRGTLLFTALVNEVEYQFRVSILFSDDRKSYTGNMEYSTDGKTWKPIAQSKRTKIAEP